MMKKSLGRMGYTREGGIETSFPCAPSFVHFFGAKEMDVGMDLVKSLWQNTGDAGG
jgi:hypothetical protein